MRGHRPVVHSFSVESAGQSLTCLAQSDHQPAEPSSKLLLTFATTGQAALTTPPYDLPARLWLAAGHTVVSFDLPNHGARIDEFGEGIPGLCAAFMAGQDPFAQFVHDGQALLDSCQAQGWGQGGIAAVGVSRAGYCALRLAAADHRIDAVAGLAPVTDWRRLREFADVAHLPSVQALTVHRWAEPLAGRAVYLAIGNRDERVGSDACVALAQKIMERKAARPDAAGAGMLRSTRLHVVDAPGHTLPDWWREEGARFLLEATG